ncbi:MAG: hypothetical protein WBO04_01820, partial [Steroidobacteraceae bacterium]
KPVTIDRNDRSRPAGTAGHDPSESAVTNRRNTQLAVLGLGGVALLMWPGPVRWGLCVPLGAASTGGLASVQWAYYKKHM